MGKDKKKTVKINEDTHNKLTDLKSRYDLKTIGQAIDKVLSAHLEEPLIISLESGHTLNLEKTKFTNFRCSGGVRYNIRNLNNVREKINMVSLLQRSVVNLNAYATLVDHFTMMKVLDKVENNLLKSPDIVALMREELNKIDSLAQSIMITEGEK